jgi:hypothetical protein
MVIDDAITEVPTLSWPSSNLVQGLIGLSSTTVAIMPVEAQVDDAHQRLPNDSTPEAQEAENVQTEWNVGRNEGLDDRSDPKWQTFAPPLGWFLLRR